MLNVNSRITADPKSIAAAGGSTTVTFQASTFSGTGQLQADYAVDGGAGYVLVGSTHLDTAEVSQIPRNYSKPLTLQRTSGGAAVVIINVTVLEVGTGETTPGSCVVTIDLAAGAGGGAAPPFGS
jgi:hypothetical protein